MFSGLISQDVLGCRCPGPKTSVRPSKIWKNSISTRTSMTRRCERTSVTWGEFRKTSVRKALVRKRVPYAVIAFRSLQINSHCGYSFAGSLNEFAWQLQVTGFLMSNINRVTGNTPRHKTDTCRKYSWGIDFGANTCAACIRTRANTRKYVWGILFEICIRTLALSLDIVPVFAHPWCQYIKIFLGELISVQIHAAHVSPRVSVPRRFSTNLENKLNPH